MSEVNNKNKLLFILEEAYKEGELVIQQMDKPFPVTIDQINQTNEKMCHLVNQFIQIKKLFNQQQENQIAEERERMTALKQNDEEGARKLISDMLHHDIAQTLYAVSLKLELIDRTVLKSLEHHFLAQFEHSLKDLVRHATKLATNIYPAMIDDLGLTAAIRSYAKNLEKNFNKKLTVELNEKLDHYSVEFQHVIFQVCRCLFNFIFEQRKQMTSVYVEIDEVDSFVMINSNINGSELSIPDSITNMQSIYLDKPFEQVQVKIQHSLTDNQLKITHLIPLSR